MSDDAEEIMQEIDGLHAVVRQWHTFPPQLQRALAMGCPYCGRELTQAWGRMVCRHCDVTGVEVPDARDRVEGDWVARPGLMMEFVMRDPSEVPDADSRAEGTGHDER